jgi:4,5-dihydroxyphthalate decarboxylase
MRNRVPISLACGEYEITRPLIEGEVNPNGIDLTVVTNMDATQRHWRFFRNKEFDMSEVSSSAYTVARDQGHPLTAIPVFPHRRFRHGFIFVNTGKGIKKPTDLIGRKVGIKLFMVSALQWLRGILEHEYGVPHKSIHWFAELDEDIEFAPPPDLKLTRLADDQSVEAMLVDGELDAVMHPDLIKPLINKDPRVARLFPDYKDEEIAYYRKTGIFPIMHFVAIRQDIVERHPWIPMNMFLAFNEAKSIAMKRMENPRIVPLAWYRHAWEEQQELLGPDPWEYGMSERNRRTLETYLGYSFEQGLTRRLFSPDELFVQVSEGRKRGGEMRI